jgi:hypothetical protein
VQTSIPLCSSKLLRCNLGELFSRVVAGAGRRHLKLDSCRAAAAVDDPAVEPDLPLRPREHLDAAHLDHGLDELVLPPALALDELVHGLLERGVGEQRLVRREEPQVVGEPEVVLVVEHRRRHEVHVRGGVGDELAAVGGADAPEQEGVGRADGGVDVAGVAEAVEAVGEGGAVGAADGVRAGEHHHVLGGEALAREVADELGGVGERGGQVVAGVGGRGDPPVAPPRGDLVGEVVPRQGDAVARREGDDVGAGDRPGAPRLDGLLGGVDDLEAPQAGIVRDRVLLRRVVRRRVDQHRAVAALGTCGWSMLVS